LIGKLELLLCEARLLRLTTRSGSAGSHGCSMVLGLGDGLKGCAARTGKRRLWPLTPPPRPSVWQ
jgi:hypothetical protein